MSCTVSELAISRCMFTPEYADLCTPPSTSEKDAIKGKWVMVNRDLNKQFGTWYLVRLFFVDLSASRIHIILHSTSITAVLDVKTSLSSPTSAFYQHARLPLRLMHHGTKLTCH
jgi:hypothetical protein